ncbi:hypothetical protein SmJEL517_g02112 [Synchytrium microbalum]|uniref:C2H2-type domain-containing protein n=1 Tax=Synchytrium microbalum TaxID=1806994 RepID=A0A507CC38_9FUNG|nr:uncharacterized protein SmJEL517_g02112 [Synchytrium microbalum]TPX35504.1 hypothetical protein SmJEL517_g02112 [Synchytrium microbalum]
MADASRDEEMKDDVEPDNKRRRPRSRSIEPRDDGRPISKRRRSLSPRDRRGGYWDSPGGYNGYNNRFDEYSYDGYGYSRGERAPDPYKIEHVVSFKHFAEWERGKGGKRIEDDEMRRRYDIYKEITARRQTQKFYDQHKHEEWYYNRIPQPTYDSPNFFATRFYEKYNAALCGPFRERVKERKTEVYRFFKEDLEAGKLDSISFDQVFIDLTSKTDTTEQQSSPVKGNGEAKAIDEELADAVEAPADKPTELDTEMKEATSATAPTQQIQPPVQPSISANEFIVADPRVGQSLFIRSVPPNFKRAEIEEVLKTYPGFKYLELSDPNPQKRYSRFGWIVLQDDSNPEDAMKVLSGKKVYKLAGDPEPKQADGELPLTEFTLHVNVSAPHANKPRPIPIESNNLGRIQDEVKVARDLARVLDEESGFKPEDGDGVIIVTNRLDVILGPDVEEPDTETKLNRAKKDLDMHIEYLKRVHFYDFYTCIECDSPEDFLRRVAVSLRRAPDPATSAEQQNNPNYIRFLERLDTRHKHRITKPAESDYIRASGGKEIEAEIDKSLNATIGKVEDSKFRCLVCTKLFKGDEFVRKHIRVKHGEVVEKTKAEFIIINNYARDPNRVHENDPPRVEGTRFGGPPPSSASYGNYSSQGVAGINGWNGVAADGGFFDGAYAARGSPYIRGRGRGYNDRGGRGRGRGRGMAMADIPPPVGAYVDPRERVSYVDLDAPASGGDVNISYE